MIFNMIASGGSTPTPTPSTGKPRKDINFIDYDGTIVESYTEQEWSSVSSLPDNPSHEGLVAQGWNYTLAQINTEVSAQGKCDIGQMYVTSSGASEIDIHIADIARNAPYLGFAVNGTAVIDWGDNTSTNTVSGTSLTSQIRTQHTYSAVGDYTIKITVSSGSMAFYGTTAYLLLSNNSSTNNANRVYTSMVQAVRIGSSVTKIGDYAFYNCHSLVSITIPSGVTSIGEYAFRACYSLASITIPNTVTSIGYNAFHTCYSLASITIPNTVTSIGTYAFNNCNGLASITIPNTVTSIGTYAFNNCYSLASITIPSGVTSIGTNAFNGCYSLASITMPSGVTSIGGSAFSNCYSLASITIPSGVTSIGTYAFSGCYGMAEYHIKPTTPPTLSNTNAFTNIPSDCIIYVPSASLSAYQSASNWSTYSSRMVGE